MNYSEELKLEVMNRIKSGELDLTQASKLYNIGGHSTIAKWLKKDIFVPKIVEQVRFPMTKIDKESSESYLSERVRKLEKELAVKELELEYSNTKVDLLEGVVEIIKREYGIDLKKKSIKTQPTTLKLVTPNNTN
jgi:hypothetical protein